METNVTSAVLVVTQFPTRKIKYSNNEYDSYISDISSIRINPSPFTQDFRGGVHLNESLQFKSPETNIIDIKI